MSSIKLFIPLLLHDSSPVSYTHLEIVCIIDINNQDDFESEAFKSADVAIEFTNPMVAYSNYMKGACHVEGLRPPVHR